MSVAMVALLLLLLDRIDSILDLDWEASGLGDEPTIYMRSGADDDAPVIASATASELGLPASLDAARLGFDITPAIPASVRGDLSRFLNRGLGNAYLRFRRRDGYLAMMDWESFFAPMLDETTNLQRLPYFSAPAIRHAPNDVALIIDPSQPAILEALEKTIEEVIRTAASTIETLHVFSTEHLLRRSIFTKFYGENVKIHEYEAIERIIKSEDELSEGPAISLQNPMLRWISNNIEHAVNSVIFVCRGAIELDQGVLQFPGPASDGSDTPSAPFRTVAADELELFLMHLGAAECAFVGTDSQEVSQAGLRMIADGLAQRRPGAVAVLSADTPEATRVFLSGHAFGVPGAFDRKEHESALRRYTLLDDLRNWEIPPRWVVSIQRLLETWIARIFEDFVEDENREGLIAAVLTLRDEVRGYLRSGGDLKQVQG